MDGSIASANPRGPSRWYCGLVGAFLLVRAATTLAGGASFDRPGDGWRAIFQLAVVVVLLVGLAYGRAAEAAVATTAVVYVTSTVLELFDGTAIFGVIPVDMRDRWVHPLLAVIGVACVVAGRLRMPRRAFG
ncbi:MAG: DUF4383 domain-containing protein [Frankia sp.]